MKMANPINVATPKLCSTCLFHILRHQSETHVANNKNLQTTAIFQHSSTNIAVFRNVMAQCLVHTY
jgi:hypothetical protein